MKDTVQSIMERRSTRHYTEEPVTDEELKTIIDAGLWAPTARNRQEVKITAVTDPAFRAAFREDFEKNDSRPRFKGFDFGAPVFLFLYGDRDVPYTEMDSGIAAENMALAAESLGLGTVIIGCIRDFVRSEAGKPWREKLGMEENDLFTCGLCIGHIAEPTKPQERKEGRVKYIR